MPPDFLTRVAALHAPRQKAADYGLMKSFELKEELGRYWRLGSDLHSRYRLRRVQKNRDLRRIGVDDWLVPFCRKLLGYEELMPSGSRTLGDRVYKITHQAWNGTVPMLFVTRDLELDRATSSLGDEGLRIAPHALMQEYLNADDRSLWGIVANGRKLRILRDNVSLTRPAYLEADLDLIFQDELYADFAALWLFAHATRLKPEDSKPSKCIAEVWRSKAIEDGERARERLREGVTEALCRLGTGFLQHARNKELPTALAIGALTPRVYLQQLLRLVYRLLFLFTAEDRNLLHIPDADEKQKSLYRDGYSLSRLRQRALRRRHYDRHGDLWQGLLITFRGLARGEIALALPALGGLFAEDQCKLLDDLALSNGHLLEAIRSLAFFHFGNLLTRVNYRDLGTEELGSVYESLLELHPVIEANANGPSLGFKKGNKKKLTGSYYTPPDLVNQLVKSTLEPVLARVIGENPEAPRKAILALKVLDPACGSGHFLLAAARRMAAELARLESDTDAYDDMARQHALREVIRWCIYGVDKNDLAVELCKAALWIEAVEPGRPLTFLNSRIRHGDSLIGLVSSDLMNRGIPNTAFKGVSGDDRKVCRELRKWNALQPTRKGVQIGLYDGSTDSVSVVHPGVANMPEDTIEDITKKEWAWQAAYERLELKRYPSNLFVGAFFAPKLPTTRDSVPTSEDLGRARVGMPRRKGVSAAVAELAAKFQFFHWHADMADVMRGGGFDVILANPPWERITLKEKEFFASRAPQIADAPNKAARQRLIEALSRKDAAPADQFLFRELEFAKRAAAATSVFLHESGRFPLTGVGDVNTYAVFAETILELLKPNGRAGMIVPTGIATDFSTKAWFSRVVESGQLVSLYDFENRKGLFTGVHKSYKFSLITLGGNRNTREVADYAFYLQAVGDLAEEERHIGLSSSDFALFNPNTKTCPIFRSRRDLEIARKMYRRSGVLCTDAAGHRPGSNPWGVKLRTMFHMANDSNLFHTREQLAARGFKLVGNVFVYGDERYMPLYEAKLFHQYDHRFATFDGVSAEDLKKGRARQLTSDEKRMPGEVPIPRYWVHEESVMDKLGAYTEENTPVLNSDIPPPPPIYTTTYILTHSEEIVERLSLLARKSVSGG